MTSKRELKSRLQSATDNSFSPTSSSLASRLPELARAGSLAKPPRTTRIERRFAAVLGSIGIVGWLTMASAGALVGVSAVGELPDPIQQFVADIVDNVGIDLPDPAEERLLDDPESLTEGMVDGEDSDQTSTSAPEASDPTPEGGGTTTPGQGGDSPGQSGGAPGQGGDSPGQSGGAPGQGGDSPGQSGGAPGQGGGSPGQSGGAPGQGGGSPGQSGSAPGRNPNSNPQ